MPGTGATVEVAVVGNGPSGLALSLFLSGWRPCYSGGHPIPELARRLEPGACLLDIDLRAASHGLSGRGHNPIANLFDALHHPGADGAGFLPTRLTLRHQPEFAVPHRVLGSGVPGGSWQQMPPEMLSLSPGSWMELPGWSLFDHARSRGRWIDPGARQPRAAMADYYRDFATHMALSEHQFNGVTVTRAGRTGDGWEVCGSGEDGVPVHVRSRFLVLATGCYDHPRTLGIPGEDLQMVTHRVPLGGEGPLLVVGAGLSAADAVLAAWDIGRPVIHCFREAPEASAAAGLDPDIYPDYHQLVRAMSGPAGPHYTPLSKARLASVVGDGTCEIVTPTGTVTHQVRQVAVLIGADPDLGFLGPHAPAPGNLLSVDPFTFRTPVDGLYAIGPLAGDNFVRFLTGHALGAAADLIRRCRV